MNVRTRTLAGAALALALLPAAARAEGGPYWKVVDFWPKRPLTTGCVGTVYVNKALPGFYTRTKVVHADGSVAISGRLPKVAPGSPTIAAAKAAEKARHFDGCWPD